MYVKKTELKDFLINRLEELVGTLTEHPLVMDGHPIHVLGRDCVIQGPPISCKEYRDLIKGFRVWDVVWDGEVIINLYEHLIGHTGGFARRWQTIHPLDIIEESILFDSKWAFNRSVDYLKDWRTGHDHLVTILSYFVIRASILRVDKILDKSRYAIYVNKGELPENSIVCMHLPVAKIQLLEEIPDFITAKIADYKGYFDRDFVTDKRVITRDATSTTVTLSSRNGESLLSLIWKSIETFNKAYEALHAWYYANVSMALSVVYQGESKPSILYLAEEEAPVCADGFLFYLDALTRKVIGINMQQIKTITPIWGDDNWKESKLQEILRK